MQKKKNKYFCTEITWLLIELFQLLMTSHYSHLLILKRKEKIMVKFDQGKTNTEALVEKTQVMTEQIQIL